MNIDENKSSFRIRRYYLVLGLVCGGFSAAMGISSTIAAFWNIDGSFPHPKLTALILGTFWSGFTLLACWMIAAYFRERLVLSARRIVQRDVFREQAVDLGAVHRVRWRTWPVGGSIVVYSPAAKIVIYLDNFSRHERAAIVRFIRKNFDESIQERWTQFEESTARASKLPQEPSSGGIVAIACILILFGAVFSYCWHVGLGGQYLALGIVNAVVAVACLWRAYVIRRRRQSDNPDKPITRKSDSKEVNALPRPDSKCSHV